MQQTQQPGLETTLSGLHTPPVEGVAQQDTYDVTVHMERGCL